MGFWDRFFTRVPSEPKTMEAAIDTPVGASGDGVSITFSDRDITFKGAVGGYDYKAILRNKQRMIQTLFELSDYYTDADPIFRGIIKEVYTPFSMDDYRLVGCNERVKKKYMEYYERIHLRDKMESIFLQYYKYANVFVYLMPDDKIITLPVNLCRIGNLAVNGEPLVEFNVRSVRDDLIKHYSDAYKKWVEDEELDIRLDGYPP